jgi:hypothetical protein
MIRMSLRLLYGATALLLGCSQTTTVSSTGRSSTARSSAAAKSGGSASSTSASSGSGSTATSGGSTGGSSGATSGAGDSSSGGVAAAGARYALALLPASDVAALLATPNVDGVSYRTGWSNLEPTAGSYDWTELDQTIQQAAGASKRVGISILGVGEGNGALPSWLYDAGVQFVTSTSPVGTSTVPVPWDPVALKAWTGLVQALGQHLVSTAELPAVLNVAVTYPIAEMSLYYCTGHGGSYYLDPPADQVPYDAGAYLGAWEQTLDAYAAALPGGVRKAVSAPENGICVGDGDTQFYETLMAYAQGLDAGFMVFAADLDSSGSQRTVPYLNLVPASTLGYQTIGSATDDPDQRMGDGGPAKNLRCAIAQGIDHGATYFEIYAVDVANTDAGFPEALASIHGDGGASLDGCP